MALQISFFIIFLFVHTNVLLGENSDKREQIIHINKLFTEKKYQDVLSIVLPAKNKNSAIYVIIANCYRELGQPTMCCAYLQKAYACGNYAQKLKITYKLAELKGKTQLDWKDKIVVKLFCFLDLLPMILLQMLAFLLLFFLLYLVSNYYHRLFLAVLVFFSMSSIIVKYQLNLPCAVTLKETKMYSAPEERAPIIGIVAENNKVYYTEESNLFYKIETLDKKRGWVLKDTMMPII